MTEPIYTRVCKKTKIMLYKASDCWEIYYSREHYQFIFAFGLPLDLSMLEVFSVAEANIPYYTDLFDDEE